jgi:hypothetical protein
MKEKTIEVCLGIGLNQIFPETTVIQIEVDPDNETIVEEPNN